MAAATTALSGWAGNLSSVVDAVTAGNTSQAQALFNQAAALVASASCQVQGLLTR